MYAGISQQLAASYTLSVSPIQSTSMVSPGLRLIRRVAFFDAA